MELFINNGNLIGKDEWKKKIDAIETDFNSLETNKERAKRKLMDAIQDALLSRTKNLGRFGVLFSGGVDSTLLAFLCKKNNLNFTCYTIGLENSQDIEYAKAIAEKYELDLKHKILSLEEFENVIKDTIKILGSYEIVWVSVGSVLYATARLALQDNIKILFGGLGTEEIFAGYQRHEEALKDNDFEALHKECWSGLKNMWQRDLLRDFKIAKNLGVELRTPYMDEGLIKTAMSVHPMYKLDKGQKKIILREVAEDFGLDKEFASRKKKAAQYGSNFIKGIDKLAKKNGFSAKKEYLQSLANRFK
ncbi:asparagine synthase C-terminal domain-containing protein [Candidatus Woesearchaeota archaeon]|nr:asparagine synthase C-terminal domain-containing protein [Candidatus Woesearchaeota archaeon]